MNCEVRYDSARASYAEPEDQSQTKFDVLVRDINRVLGPTNGIDSADVDVQELQALMAAYQSDEHEWSRYAFADSSRPYTRNLVDHGNGKSNLLILVWSPGRSSPIHDHANAHCVMKVLKGSLKETLYRWPCQHTSGSVECSASDTSAYTTTEHTCSRQNNSLRPGALSVERETSYTTNGVTYMSDRLGLHRISNPHNSELAISLHLYTPPNAAKHGCHIFNEETGKKSHVQQCHFYSELGVKT